MAKKDARERLAEEQLKIQQDIRRNNDRVDRERARDKKKDEQSRSEAETAQGRSGGYQ